MQSFFGIENILDGRVVSLLICSACKERVVDVSSNPRHSIVLPTMSVICSRSFVFEIEVCQFWLSKKQSVS